MADEASSDQRRPNQPGPGRPRPGRPRSTESRDAILAATRKLLATQTVRDLSIEGIAREAGVGKTTIYRWWPSKATIVLEAVEGQIAPPAVDAKKPAKALAKHIVGLIGLFSDESGSLVAGLLAEGRSDGEAQAAIDAAFLTPLRSSTAQVIEQAKSAGEVDAGLSAAMAQDLIYGPLLSRLFMGGHPLSKKEASEVSDRILLSLADAMPAPKRKDDKKKSEKKKKDKKKDK